jgi:hypothetical protein
MLWNYVIVSGMDGQMMLVNEMFLPGNNFREIYIFFIHNCIMKEHLGICVIRKILLIWASWEMLIKYSHKILYSIYFLSYSVYAYPIILLDIIYIITP